ncbi:hypothetical protein GPB2148_3769 [marine gamma proteobacterium HTCC2148]|nr:hypothetical protein GPB2148_3769 [marine gamma proteobacterium HTCC2148]
MQQENTVHGLGQNRADVALLAGHAKHHVKKVFSVAHAVIGVHERLADREFVAHCCDSWHFGDQAKGSNFAAALIRNIQRVMVEGRECANHATHNGHRVGITTEAVEEMGQLFVDHGMAGDSADKRLFFFFRRKFAVKKQVAGLKIVGVLGQLFNGVAAVQQDAFAAIDIGNL